MRMHVAVIWAAWSESHGSDAGERTLTYRLTDFLGKSALVTADLIDERGAIVDQVRAKPVMVVQDSRRQKEFTPLVSFGGTKHYLQDTQMSMVRGVAADTGFTWSGDVDNSLNIPRGTFGVIGTTAGQPHLKRWSGRSRIYQRNATTISLGYLTQKELSNALQIKKFLQTHPFFQ